MIDVINNIDIENYNDDDGDDANILLGKLNKKLLCINKEALLQNCGYSILAIVKD